MNISVCSCFLKVVLEALQKVKCTSQNRTSVLLLSAATTVTGCFKVYIDGVGLVYISGQLYVTGSSFFEVNHTVVLCNITTRCPPLYADGHLLDCSKCQCHVL